MEESGYILEARGLHKSFGRPPAQEHVLRGLDLEVRRGEFLAVMGPSGCGKSTLLHLLGLMSTPDDGEVFIAGQSVGGLGEAKRARVRRERIGFVFQRFNLISVLSGYDNVRLSLRIRGSDENGPEVAELLEALGVASAARRKPSRMSIGQQQRLAVARALAGGPDLLLADEPTGSLDSGNRQGLLKMLRWANQDRGQTIVMITHSASVAGWADRILTMDDGRILDETA